MTAPAGCLPSAWSASALSQHLQCSARYRYERVEKHEPEFTSGSALLGSAVHCAAAWMRRHIADGQDPSAEEARAVFAETFLALTLGEESRIRLPRNRTIGDLCQQGTALVDVLHEHIDHDEKVVAIEHPFRFAVRLGTGESRDVVGVLDLVVVEPDGVTAIVDLKTRARPFAGQNTAHEIQPTIYALAGAPLGASRFRFDALVKTAKRPRFEQNYVERDGSGLDVLRRMIETVERGLVAGVFLPSPGPLCDHCPYQARCRAEWGQQPRQSRRLALAAA